MICAQARFRVCRVENRFPLFPDHASGFEGGEKVNTRLHRRFF
jgi:hypothetical protein